MHVLVSRAALARIRRGGGRLYLWQHDVGSGFATERLGTEPPWERVDFDSFDVAGVEIRIDRSIELPRELRIQARWWPFGGVKAYFDGVRFGWRGIRAAGITGVGG